jgi:hypothetical protein
MKNLTRYHSAGTVNPALGMIHRFVARFLSQIEQDLEAFTPEWFADHPEIATARELDQEELLNIADLPPPYDTLGDSLYDFLASLVEERTSNGLEFEDLRQVLLSDTGGIGKRILLRMFSVRGSIQDAALKVFAEYVDDILFPKVVKSFHKLAKASFGM